MHNPQKKIIGAVLILVDVFMYGLFHDITKLAIFSKIKDCIDFSTYVEIQSAFYSVFRSIPLYKIVNNYLIDLIWFIAFLVIGKDFIKSKYYCFIIFFFGIITELVQLLYPNYGTFDIFDILVYLGISIIFFVKEQYL